MMKRNSICCILIGWLLCMGTPVWAEEYNIDTDSIHKKLYANFLDLYSSHGRDQEFYQATDTLARYYRSHGLTGKYYKMQLNICLYDTEHQHSDRALSRSQRMLKEMEEEGFDAYSQVYTALGTVYESRGNFSVARHYYEKAIENLPPDDPGSKMGLYSRLAYLLMFQQPVEAKRWNERYLKESLTFPPYHQVYLFIDGMISFALGDEHQFRQTYDAYQQYHASQKGLDNYGQETLEMVRLAFDAKYDEALQLLNHPSSNDLSLVACYDARIRIQQMMKRPDLALETAQQRAECIDSLNSDMYFANLNELNAAAGVSQAKAMASRTSDLAVTTGMVLALIIIAMLVALVINFRKGREEQRKKNEQLRSALAMAEEGEKMKTEFVRQVSHEIRTPLNAIRGFNELLNTPGIDVSDEERADMLQRISINIDAITNIVDEMLALADKGSNELYERNSRIYCNKFFSELLYSHRSKVSSAIELQYLPKVINRFQIETNEEGLRKVAEELIKNAIKFTKEGYIRITTRLNDDHSLLLVSVEDSGRGIPKEQQDKIFDGFYKVDTFEQGIGLGLAVSKKIAQKLGGDLTLDTSYIGGARFVLSLPAKSF